MVKLNSKGQAITEYLLLLIILVFGILTVFRLLKDKGLAARLTKPITEDFIYAYKNGHPKARAYDDEDGPKKHPRIVEGSSNFRIFLNPK